MKNSFPDTSIYVGPIHTEKDTRNQTFSTSNLFYLQIISSATDFMLYFRGDLLSKNASVVFCFEVHSTGSIHQDVVVASSLMSSGLPKLGLGEYTFLIFWHFAFITVGRAQKRKQTQNREGDKGVLHATKVPDRESSWHLEATHDY